MRISAPKRRRGGAKRFDPSGLQAWIEALMARKQYATLATVVAPDGGSHYELVAGDGDTLAAILVEVETMPDRVPLTCTLAEWGWLIPDVGDEVVVIIPSGQIDFQPVIVAIRQLSIPNPTGQGPAPGRRVIVADEVLVHDGSGGAESLALKTDVVDVWDYIDKQFDNLAGHTHPVAGSTTWPPVTATTLPPPTIGSPTGTDILKGK